MPLVRRRSDAREVDCLATDNVGDFVYVTSADAVAKADPMNGSKMPAIGVIERKASPTRAFVRFGGAVVGFAGLAPGGRYFVGATGAASLTPPPGPGRRYVQHVGVAITPTTLIFEPQDPTIVTG